jgi:LemA protein
MWLFIAAASLVGGILVYNALVRRRNAADNAFAAVDTYLMMRYELIPNLVETVKGYAAHERATIERVVALRREALEAKLEPDARVRLDNRIAGDMRTLVALAEAYPDLKASEGFLQLQRSLNEVEERISAARRGFNASVLEYNNLVGLFPMNLVARALGFRTRAYFASPDEARAPVDVGSARA